MSFFLHHFYHPTGGTEDVFDYFCPSFYILTVFDVQQGDVFVHLMGFFWDPQDGAALGDFKALFGLAFFSALRYRHT